MKCTIHTKSKIANIVRFLDHSSRITSTFTGCSYITQKNVTCKSRNIIYCITCRTSKNQHVGQTKLSGMDRIQAHLEAKDPRQQTDTSHHFKQVRHNGREDVQVHILDFIYTFPHSKRAAMIRDETELQWMHRLQTQLPIDITPWINLVSQPMAKSQNSFRKRAMS